MEKALPAIPAKRYFTIGEVSELCGVKPYVLRYWEQEFTQLKPMKRRGNRRYYQHHEVLLIRRIRELLYDQGFTISGARNRLSDASMAARARRGAARATVRRRRRGGRRGGCCRPAAGCRSAGCRAGARAVARRTDVDPRPADRLTRVHKGVTGRRYTPRLRRGVAQPGSALAWGARGREFESRRPDQRNQRVSSHKGLARFDFWLEVRAGCRSVAGSPRQRSSPRFEE